MVFQVPEEELEACPLPEWVFLLVTVKEDFAVWETDVWAAAWVGRVPVRSVQDRQRPVSYTHLDVYKRQRFWSSIRSRKPGWMPGFFWSM